MVPKANEFPVVVTNKVKLADGWTKTKSSGMYNPRKWKWLNTITLANKSLVQVLEKRRTCASIRTPTHLRGMFKPTMFKEANKRIELLLKEN